MANKTDWENKKEKRKYFNEKQMEYYWRNREKCIKRMKGYRDKDRAAYNKRARDYNLKIKIKVMEAYGGCKCAHCGIEDIEILCIDHIDNNGQEHRKKMGHKRMYNWLVKNNFPPGFQILCRNCNWKKLLAWKRKEGK